MTVFPAAIVSEGRFLFRLDLARKKKAAIIHPFSNSAFFLHLLGTNSWHIYRKRCQGSLPELARLWRDLLSLTFTLETMSVSMLKEEYLDLSARWGKCTGGK